MKLILFVIGLFLGIFISVGVVEMYFNKNIKRENTIRADGSSNNRYTKEKFVGDSNTLQKNFINRYFIYHKNLIK